MTQGDNVRPLNARPKQSTQRYRKVLITITYIPVEGKWEWSFEKKYTTIYRGTAETVDDAWKAARAKVDQITGTLPPPPKSVA